jgi:LysM repeat protein
MTAPLTLLRAALLAFCAVFLSGCWPSSRSQLDEEKEPHFLAGKARVNAMDYQGAIETFEKALEVNPHSGAAHFEAGLLYEKYKQDYAAAIYHFDRFLEQRPKSDYAEVVRQRILACKQELAKTVSLGPVAQSLQSEFDKISEENKRLHEEVDKWRAFYARNPIPTNTPAITPAAPRPAPPSASATVYTAAATLTNSTPASAAARNSPAPRVASASVADTRTHTVKSGETLMAIAKRYGVKVDTLMAANPRLDARRMQVGQSVNIPAL